nr:hypothetical protein Iba_scaffold31413CG0010 [Ipomoea batatas]GMD17632.1 hypothetical protein Iba_chr07dCG5470 [Ipomoea batatas]
MRRTTLRREWFEASPLQLPLGRTEEGDGGVGAARVLRHLNAATLFCRCRRSFEERVEEAAATVDGGDDTGSNREARHSSVLPLSLLAGSRNSHHRHPCRED